MIWHKIFPLFSRFARKILSFYLTLFSVEICSLILYILFNPIKLISFYDIIFRMRMTRMKFSTTEPHQKYFVVVFFSFFRVFWWCSEMEAWILSHPRFSQSRARMFTYKRWSCLWEREGFSLRWKTRKKLSISRLKFPPSLVCASFFGCSAQKHWNHFERVFFHSTLE